MRILISVTKITSKSGMLLKNFRNKFITEIFDSVTDKNGELQWNHLKYNRHLWKRLIIFSIRQHKKCKKKNFATHNLQKKKSFIKKHFCKLFQPFSVYSNRTKLKYGMNFQAIIYFNNPSLHICSFTNLCPLYDKKIISELRN